MYSTIQTCYFSHRYVIFDLLQTQPAEFDFIFRITDQLTRSFFIK